jgi:hypothetical protein
VRDESRRLADELHEWASYRPGELRNPSVRPARPGPREPGVPPVEYPGQLPLPLPAPTYRTAPAPGTPSESEFRRWGGGDVSGVPHTPVVVPSPPMRYRLAPEVTERLVDFLYVSVGSAAAVVLVAGLVEIVALAMEGLAARTVHAASAVDELGRRSRPRRLRQQRGGRV